MYLVTRLFALSLFAFYKTECRISRVEEVSLNNTTTNEPIEETSATHNHQIFSVTKNVEFTLTSAFQSVTSRSAIECSVVCLETDGCCMASYRKDEKSCQLSTECESGFRPSGNTVTIQTRSMTGSYTCPNHWQQYDKSCYWFSRNPLSWQDDMNYCLTYGGYLTEATNEDELNFLTDSGWRRDRWSGGTFLQVDGRWKWFTSQENFTVTDWRGAEPNIVNGQESCLSILESYNGWLSRDCSIEDYYTCEKSAM